MGADIAGALQAMEARLGQVPMVVLVTGDPGMHILAHPVMRHFGRLQCRIIPDISFVQTAFAAAGLDWMEARVLRAHGAISEIDPKECETVYKIAVLAGSPSALRWIADLAKRLAPRWVFVCEELTLPGEPVTKVTADMLARMEPNHKTVVLLRPEVLDI